MPRFVRSHGNSLGDETPWQPSPGLCSWHHGPVCRVFSFPRYRYHRAQPYLEGCNGYRGPPWPFGSYDTRPRLSDRISPDHVGADERKSPRFGWLGERWPKTNPVRAFGSCERWCERSVRFDAGSWCIDTAYGMQSDRRDCCRSEDR